MAISEEKQKLKEQQQRCEAESQRPRQNAGEINTNTTTDEAQTLVADGFLVPSLEPSGDCEQVPPAYGEQHDHVQFSQPGFDAGAEVTGNTAVRDVRLMTFGRNTNCTYIHTYLC